MAIVNAAVEPLSTWATEDLVQHLRRRGVTLTAPVRSTLLEGGVSGTVLRLDASDRSVVVKQALAELTVAVPWHADPSRLLTEGEALRVMHRLSPPHVPGVVDLDADRLLLVMTAAPPGWLPWKERLLAGSVAPADHALADQLGATLRRWHDATRADAWVAGLGSRDRFANRADFTALRLDPFYRYVADATGGAVGAALTGLAEGLAASSDCLVHGDVSPKNLLTAADGEHWWLLDAECAVLGDPVFDVAFPTAHLLLKSLDPARIGTLGVAQRLWDSYRGSSSPFSEQHLTAHTAAIMLARVAGVSQVDYLDESQRVRVRRCATAALLGPPETLDELTRVLHESGAS